MITSIDMDVLALHVNMDFETFKALHLQNQNPASSYYLALKLQGEEISNTNIENHGRPFFGHVGK